MSSAIVFPGQGSQVVGMGKDLFDNFAFVRDIFQEANDALKVNLSKIMFEGPSEELTKTENTQPALMAVSIALIIILEKEFGRKFEDLCSFTAGHSLGEYSALCAAKAISFKQAIDLLRVRGYEMANCGKKIDGAMAAILGVEIQVVEDIVCEAAQGEVCQIANDNSVGQVVISGSRLAIDRAIKIAKDKGARRAILLPVSGAFHSDLMLDARDKMKDALVEAEINPPIVPVVTNVTANAVSDPGQVRIFLEQQITGSVRWRETMLFFASQGVKEVIEVGSGKVLSGLVGRTCPDLKSRSIQNFEDLKSFISTL